MEQLGSLLDGRERVLVLLHDNPDPDSMAGGLCLAELIEELWSPRPRLVHGGIIGRAENRNMVRSLELPLWTMESIKVRPEEALVMVDTQPGFGNNSAPDGCDLLAVIDHHPPVEGLEAPLVDVRPEYGAVTTILTEYLVSAGVELTPRLATAICYGISSETQDLGREASEADIAAYLEAFPLSEQPLLGRLHHPQRSPVFFAELSRAIEAARIADDVLVCHMGAVSTAETVPETADMLISVEGIQWVMCSGLCGGALVLSVRSTQRDARAGQLLRRVVGEPSRAGGHGMIAGGSIPLEEDGDPDELQQTVARQFLEELGMDPGRELEPLMAQPGVPGAEEVEN